jgi:hypothetical protein
MAGLDPAIRSFFLARCRSHWMAASRAAMTNERRIKELMGAHGGYFLE